MSQWGELGLKLHGLDPADLDGIQVTELHAAMFRRRIFEARLDAMQIVAVLGKALSKGKGKSKARAVEWVAPEVMLAEAGMEL